MDGPSINFINYARGHEIIYYIFLLVINIGRSESKKKEISPQTPQCSIWSGREDLNLRPPAPKAGALTRLRYAPKYIH